MTEKLDRRINQFSPSRSKTPRRGNEGGICSGQFLTSARSWHVADHGINLIRSHPKTARIRRL